MARMKKTEREALKREIGIRDVRIQSLEYARDRYKREKRNLELKEDANLALCTALVRKYGEVTIAQEEINEIIEKRIYASVHADKDKRIFRIFIPEAPAEK